MDQLTVDFSVLRGLADDIAALIDATDDSLDKVDAIVAELKSSWTGLGHDAFHDAITEWSSSARDLRDQMHWIRDVVVHAHENHATAVHTNVRIWRG